MANALALFDQKSLELPDHLKNAFGEESNLPERQTVPSLTYKGKVWTVSVDGEKNQIKKVDEDGDEMPVQVLSAVILDYGKRRGRALYEGGFEEDKPKMPICWSDDGIAASPKVTEGEEGPNGFVTKPLRKCETCPMAAKGSKVDERGKAVVACGQHRMIAVLPVIPKKGFYPKPLRLKIAITSDYDKQAEDQGKQGWFAFQQFIDFCRGKGINHTAMVLIKMKFDDSVAYPKLFFSPTRWLSPAEVDYVAPLTKSEEVAGLISAGWTPNGVDGTKTDELPGASDGDDEETLPPAKQTKPAKAAPEKKAAPKKAPVEDDEDEDTLPERPAARTTKKAAEPAKPAKKAKPADDDDDETLIPAKEDKPAKAAAKPAKAAAPVEEDEDEGGEAAAPPTSDVDALLAEWDD